MPTRIGTAPAAVSRSAMPGNSALERGQATAEEAVDVSALRNTRARFGARGQTIAFEHSHP